MEKIIALNHKMNMDFDELQNYIDDLKKLNLNLIVFPTAIHAPYFVRNNLKTGLQNIYFQDDGAYTGETSPKQAKKLGIEYVLVGHSERRELFAETNEEINKKIQSALANGLKVILCIGEKSGEDYQKVLKNQINEGLKNIQDQVIIAYEPVWAIGTGQTPNNQEIETIISYIKSLFDYDVKVLYGGSVNSTTIETINAVKVVSGYLIGGSSTNISELKKIKEVVS